jgi:hypothetical protein
MGYRAGVATSTSGLPPIPSPLWVYAGVGAHGGAPNVAAPPRPGMGAGAGGIGSLKRKAQSAKRGEPLQAIAGQPPSPCPCGCMVIVEMIYATSLQNETIY